MQHGVLQYLIETQPEIFALEHSPIPTLYSWIYAEFYFASFEVRVMTESSREILILARSFEG